jgi:hypothetical protein
MPTPFPIKLPSHGDVMAYDKTREDFVPVSRTDFPDGLTVGGGGKLLKRYVAQKYCDFTSTADGAVSTYIDVLVSGIRVDRPNVVKVGLSSLTYWNVDLFATVVSDDFVRVSIFNKSGASIDPAGGILTVVVEEYPVQPTGIPGLQLYLVDTTLSGSDGDAIGTWTKSGGVGSNATQATSGKKPLLKIVGDVKCLRFDGVDDFLHAAISGMTSDCTVLVLAKFNSAGTGALVDLSSDDSSTNTAAQLYELSGSMRAIYAGGVSGQAQATFTDTTDYHVHTGKYSASGRTLYRDGVQVATNAVAATLAAATGVRIGELFQDVYPASVDIRAVLVYDSALSNTDRANAEAYLVSL